MKPLSHREVVRKFRVLGFVGPFSGGRHPFMQKGSLKIHVPAPHGQDISVGLQKEVLRQAGISERDWENV